MKLTLFTCLAALLLAACSSNAPDPKVLVLGTDPTYPPYESVAVDGQCEGFDIDVAQAIAEKLNKKLVIKQFGFTALILSLKQNKVDLIAAGMSITPSRQKEIEMIPYQGGAIKSFYLLFWKDKPADCHLENLHLVAVMVGTCEEDYLRQLPQIAYKSLENTTEIIMDLQYGKSDAALIEPKVAMLLKDRFPEIQLVEVPLEEKHWTLGKGIGIEKSNAQMIEQVRSAIADLQADGTIQKLEQKWMKE